MDNIIIGDKKVDGVFMLDKDTCVLSFETKQAAPDEQVNTIVEYWKDEDTWHFVDEFFDNDGNYTDAEESTRLTDEEKEECKRIINDYIKSKQ